MIRKLAIFLAFFALILKAPLYTVESPPKCENQEIAIKSTIVPDCNFEPNTPQSDRAPCESYPISCESERLPLESLPISSEYEVISADENQIPYESGIPADSCPVSECEIPCDDPFLAPFEEPSFDPPCYPPDQKFAPNGCPVPPGGCQPYNKCDPNINPYAPPPEGACCPPAPIRGAHWGLNAATMILPIMLVVGVAAIILVEHSDSSH